MTEEPRCCCFMLTDTKPSHKPKGLNASASFTATTQKHLLTSMWSPTFLTEREEKVAFANCPQNPRARRIFTSQTVSLPLIFQSPRAWSLTGTLCHFSLNAMCKRLINDSGLCLSGHLGVTGAHTLVGGPDYLVVRVLLMVKGAAYLIQRLNIS